MDHSGLAWEANSARSNIFGNNNSKIRNFLHDLPLAKTGWKILYKSSRKLKCFNCCK